MSWACAMVIPPGRASSRPDVVCICRTNGIICSSASAGGVMTASTPSPRTLSSESVTTAATSIRASLTMSRPVISQSTQTMRSFVAGVALTGVTVRAPVARPGARTVTPVSATPATNDRIVWVDCEMTGLDIVNDALIEVAAVVTDSELRVLGEGVDAVITPPAEALEQMIPFVRQMHTTSGLLEALPGGMTMAQAQDIVLDYVRYWVPEPCR